MTNELRNDLVAIILHEAFAYNEAYIERWLAGKFDRANPAPNDEDIAAMGAAQYIVSRMEARCSKIEG